MNTAASTLARYAANLKLEDVPAPVRARAISCIVDTIACSIHGSRFPWSQATAQYAKRYGSPGPCTLFGNKERISAPFAAFANGAAAHAFEQDSLRFPGAGVHPGATLVPALIAACQETRCNGATALIAFIASCEVLFRIGAATHHSSEHLGFHAPGLTGPYGAAIAAGLVYGLDATQLRHALGIAGSMSAGLLAFTKAHEGVMVKRLHIGRASEAGIVAARLAASAYTGPETILEGRFGFLETYCSNGDPSILTAGLGKEWETLKICIKRYPCHVTAQPAMQRLRQLMSEHDFGGDDVASLTMACSEKIASHHDIREPADIMKGQYSVPFCLALALYRDPEDPDSFSESALDDPSIRRICQTIQLRPTASLPSAWSAHLSLELKDGRKFEVQDDGFKGMPSHPLSTDEQRSRFLLLTQRHLSPATASNWYDALISLGEQAQFPLPLLDP